MLGMLKVHLEHVETHCMRVCQVKLFEKPRWSATIVRHARAIINTLNDPKSFQLADHTRDAPPNIGW